MNDPDNLAMVEIYEDDEPSLRQLLDRIAAPAIDFKREGVPVGCCIALTEKERLRLEELIRVAIS